MWIPALALTRYITYFIFLSLFPYLFNADDQRTYVKGRLLGLNEFA